MAVSASLSLMKVHSAFPAVHEHHPTTTALVSETLKESVKAATNLKEQEAAMSGAPTYSLISNS